MHGIILHEEYREWMRKLSPEDLGRLIENLFLVDDGEEPVKFDDDYLDFFSDVICGRLGRDIATSDKQRNNGLKGGAPKGNQNARKTSQNQTKVNPKTIQKQPKNNPKQTPITNNLLPITNNQYKETNKEIDPFADDVISYLNFKAGTHYQSKGKTLQLINARVKDGFTTDDFKKVIDKKVEEWKGTPYEKFIRPSTLFAPGHFEEYLNQPVKSTDDMLMNWLNGGQHDEGRIYTDSQDDEGGIYRPEVYTE